MFLENNRDNLEQMRKEIANMKEKLDSLMNRLPVEEKKLRMEGKIYPYQRGAGSFFMSRESKSGKRYFGCFGEMTFIFGFFINQNVKNVSRPERLCYSWCETAKN